MKLTSVVIDGFRGLREFEHQFKGKSLLVYGLNGTGKSSFSQAIEFAATGIPPHIWELSSPSGLAVFRHKGQAPVKPCTVKITGEHTGTKFTIERRIHSDGRCDKIVPSTSSERLINEGIDGTCFIIRRKYVELIDAVEKERWTRLTPLLGFMEIASFRNGLRNIVRGNLRKYFNSTSLSQRVKDLTRDKTDLRNRITSKMKDLGLKGDPVDAVRAEILSFLPPGTEIGPAKSPLNWDSLHQLMEVWPAYNDTMSRLSQANQLVKRISLPKAVEWNPDADVGKVADYVAEVSADPRLFQHAKWAKFFQVSLDIAIEVTDGVCPFCALTPTDWGGLTVSLGEKLHRHQGILDRHSQTLRTLQRLTHQLHDLKSRLRDAEAVPGAERVASLVDEVLQATHAVRNKVETHDPEGLQPLIVVLLQVRAQAKVAYKELLKQTKENQMELSVSLEKIDETRRLGRLVTLREIETAAIRSQQIEQELVSATKRRDVTDSVIGELDRFFTLVDNSDQELSTSSLTRLEPLIQKIFAQLTTQDKLVPSVKVQTSYGSRGAAIELNDFHGLGPVPARDYLSEANRNALGLSILFASFLTRPVRNTFLVLDDITHSSDSYFKRALAEFIIEELLPGRQLIILTHDDNWYHRIASEADTFKTLKVTDWKIDGVTMSHETWVSMLARAGLEVSASDTRAGNTIRYALEEFVDKICEKYRAMVPFQADTKKIGFETKRQALEATIKDLWTTGHGYVDPNSRALAYLKLTQRLGNLASHYGSFASWNMADLSDALADLNEFISLFTCKNSMGTGICRSLAPSLKKAPTMPECSTCHQPFSF